MAGAATGGSSRGTALSGVGGAAGVVAAGGGAPSRMRTAAPADDGRKMVAAQTARRLIKATIGDMPACLRGS
jgi:hypothetical protein